MTPYPLDYQLCLAQTIRAQLGAEALGERAAHLRDALSRLHCSDFGECGACGGVIPYPEIAADPAARRCVSCGQGSFAAAGRPGG